MISVDAPVVFLHLPKTAGQTVHAALQGLVGPECVSPVRVHTQAGPGERQMPPGYAVYSGHLDWMELDLLPRRRFVFTVLRDPRERIASFYLYLRRQAEQMSAEDLSLPQNLGKARILDRDPSDYFLGGDERWQAFIHDHYDNFYCTYFATRRMRGWAEARALSPATLLDRATAGLSRMNKVYMTHRLARLERDLRWRTLSWVQLASNFGNSLDLPPDRARWPILTQRLSPAALDRLEGFVAADEALLRRANLAE